MPLTVRQFCIQLDAAPPYFSGEVQNWLMFFLGDRLSAQTQMNEHQDPWTSCPYTAPPGSYEVQSVSYQPIYH